jgi:NitT/TauT family transport system substrate-binding protein
MKKLIALLITLVLAAGVTGCSSKSSTPEPKSSALTKFNLGYLPTPGSVLYFVAKEKGYFEQQGLDVQLFQFTNSGEGLNAIQAGKIDAGAFGTAAPLTFIAKGSNFTIFGGEQSEGAAVIAKPDKAAQFKDLQNYKGKSVATVRLATGDVVFRGALTEAGIDWKKDVTLKELESPATVLEAVKKGEVDAGVVWSPYITMAEKQGLKVVEFSSEMMPNHVCCRQVALTDKIKQNPKEYEQFMAALIEAYQFYQTNHEETINLLSKYVKIDKDILQTETYGGHILSNPDPNKDGVVDFWKYMNKVGYISSGLKIEDHINTEIFKNALDSVLKQNPNDAVYQKLKADFKG